MIERLQSIKRLWVTATLAAWGLLLAGLFVHWGWGGSGASEGWNYEQKQRLGWAFYVGGVLCLGPATLLYRTWQRRRRFKKSRSAGDLSLLEKSAWRWMLMALLGIVAGALGSAFLFVQGEAFRAALTLESWASYVDAQSIIVLPAFLGVIWGIMTMTFGILTLEKRLLREKGNG